MIQTRRVKLFKNGASQAVRLPMEFRFDGDEVYASRDDLTGDVTLSVRPGASAWHEFFALLHTVEDTGEFMNERPLNVPPADRGVFDEDSPPRSR